MSKYKKHRPMCHMIVLTLMMIVLFSTALGLDTTNSQEQVKVKYRHRRENDEDENFIALAPADGDEFNLESVLDKDKQMPAIVRLDPVLDSSEETEDDFIELSAKKNDDNDNGSNNDYKNYDADKYNRFFDSVDINEEQRRILNDSTPVFGRIDSDADDYLDSTTVLTTTSTTTTTTSTPSPYVREIYKTSAEVDDDLENNNYDEDTDEDDDELQLRRNHHSKFKKMRKHTRKHHKSSSYLPEYYSHSFSPAHHHFSRFHRDDEFGENPHSHRRRTKHRNRKLSQTFGTEQRQVKDDGQFRSGYRANYGSDQYRGRISFYDNSNRLETHDDVTRKINGKSKEKYPYFNKVKSHLEEEDDDLPPYVKKYNRRNKQLIDLLEGTLPPQSEKRFHAKKNPHWLEDDLFEEQKPSKNKWSTEIEATAHPNALPEDNVRVIYDEKSRNFSKSAKFNLTASSIASNNHSPPFKVSSRAGQFIYHTVTQSPSASGSGIFGGVKKKRLPFVAITDRKVGSPTRTRRRTDSNNSISTKNEQNRLTMP
ncbi:putative pre-mRNA-splicing factor ATP-dependent RNA helicase DHX16 [Culicoides brevitarsis]|uniref:putative pre-mRNA-splicing factor ATP-dependent RNA helicase DHX16 n=1 Tax=Culicoides brevitarsis TaxID=469753 RepID=UPI00307B99E8